MVADSDVGEDLPPLRPQDYVTDILDITEVEYSEFQEWEEEARAKARDHG